MDFDKSQKFLERLEKFSDDINQVCKETERNTVTIEIISQLVRSAGSIGANYIEAIESLSQKDFYYRIRICRKESKESGFWLRRLLAINDQKGAQYTKLTGESREFVLIFSKIIVSSKNY